MYLTAVADSLQNLFQCLNMFWVLVFHPEGEVSLPKGSLPVSPGQLQALEELGRTEEVWGVPFHVRGSMIL